MTTSVSKTELLDVHDVTDRTSLSRRAIYTAMSRGDFPKPRRLGPRRVAWLGSDIDAWILARPVAGDAPANGGGR